MLKKFSDSSFENNDSAYEIIIRNLEAEIREHIKVKKNLQKFQNFIKFFI